MQITRAWDYAVRVMIYLASLPEGSTVRQSQMSRATEVSGHFLSKVLQQLVRARLIRLQRGSGGGAALAAPAAGVSLLDVVQAMEGPVRLNQCMEEGPSRQRKAWCPAHQVWAEAQAAITNVTGKSFDGWSGVAGKGDELPTAPQNGLDHRCRRQVECNVKGTRIGNGQLNGPFPQSGLGNFLIQLFLKS
jgi:Rrf2 family protein